MPRRLQRTTRPRSPPTRRTTRRRSASSSSCAASYDGPGRARSDVKIQTFRDDHWLNLDGARVTTRTDGSYRVRVVLNIRGVRDLRAVGIAGDGHRNSYARFVVEVFR